MELELVRFRYNFIDDSSFIRRSLCMLVPASDTMDDIKARLADRVFPNILDFYRTDSVPFHQEDAFVLGLKVGDIL